MAKAVLRPGTHIAEATARRDCFLFSGLVKGTTTGITVAHPLLQGQSVAVVSDTGNLFEYTLGICRETFKMLEFVNGDEITADLALLEIDTENSTPENAIFWPRSSHQQRRVRIYTGAPVPGDTPVMIVDQSGVAKYGFIRRENGISNKMHEIKDLRNVLAVSRDEQYCDQTAITQEGDSGALVMSVPKEDPDEEILVYGIVIGLRTFNSSSLTVANDLPAVLRRLAENKKLPPNDDFN